MNNLRIFYGFFCFWILHITFCHSGTVTYTLLFMESGGATLDSPKTMAGLWDTVGGTNDPANNKHTKTFGDLKQGGDFRSSLVDNWNTDTPSSVTLELYNAQGDSLFFLIFDTTGTTGTGLDWLKVDKIIDSSHDLTGETLTVIDSDSYGMEYRVQRTSAPDDVWFTIWHGPFLSKTKSTPDYPAFLFSHNTTTPNTFTTTPGRVALYNCYQDGLSNILESHTSPDLRFEDCMVCTPQTGGLLFMRNGECFCALREQTTSITDLSQCNGTCDGNSNQFYCGSGAIYAAYYTSGVRSNEPYVPAILTTFFDDTFAINVADSDFQVDLSNVLQSADYGYISKVKLDPTITTSSTATMYYNVDGVCDLSTANLLMNSDFSAAVVLPLDGSVVDVGIIPARCVIFKLQGLAASLSIRVSLYTPTDDFIQAPYLTIKGDFVTVDTTPGEVSTSAAASTTVPVQETTATKITSTEVTTTEPSTTGSTTSIKITTQPHTTTEMLTSTVHVTSGATVNDITDNSATTTQQLTTTNGLTSNSSLPPISQTTTTDQETTQNNQYTSRSTVKSVCSSCVCNHVINMSIVLTEEEAQKLILIRQNLTVDKTNLSSFLRTKISAPDNRTSAVGLGVVGIAVMCFVFGGIVIIDMSRFRTVFYKVNEQKS